MVSKEVVRALGLMKFVEAMRKKLKVMHARTELVVWDDTEDAVTAEDTEVEQDAAGVCESHVVRLLHHPKVEVDWAWWFSNTLAEKLEIVRAVLAVEDIAPENRLRLSQCERDRLTLVDFSGYGGGCCVGDVVSFDTESDDREGKYIATNFSVIRCGDGGDGWG